MQMLKCLNPKNATVLICIKPSPQPQLNSYVRKMTFSLSAFLYLKGRSDELVLTAVIALGTTLKDNL